MTSETWADEIAGWLLEGARMTVPTEVVDKASLQIFDTLACAAAAAKSPPARAMMDALGGPASGPCTLLFQDGTASVQDAILVNGTSVRYMDFNDSYIGKGPGGHPSDNIPVALAFAEANGNSGRQTLTTIALGYELYWRLRQTIMKPSGSKWDGVSVSSVVAAGMGGLLTGLSREALTQAIAIAASRGYALGEVRGGDISMLKASANALVARDGALAALLANCGMTGPPAIFEGQRGLLPAIGLQPGPDVLASLLAPVEWHLLRAAIKAYPAIGTSQGLLHGTQVLSERLRSANIDIDLDVLEVLVRLPDSRATHEHLAMKERLHPKSRESADHSLPFLVACVLREGSLRAGHFELELWLDPDVRALMDRVRLQPDAAVTEHAIDCYPAIVEVKLRDGRVEVEEVLRPPGTAQNPFSVADVARKFRDVQDVGLSDGAIDVISSACANLADAADVGELLSAAR